MATKRWVDGMKRRIAAEACIKLNQGSRKNKTDRSKVTVVMQRDAGESKEHVFGNLQTVIQPWSTRTTTDARASHPSNLLLEVQRIGLLQMSEINSVQAVRR